MSDLNLGCYLGTHKDGTKQLTCKRTKEQVLIDLKKEVLKYLTRKDRFKTIEMYVEENKKGNRLQLTIVEEGRGVVEFWHERKIKFMFSLVTPEEVKEEEERVLQIQKENALTYAQRFQKGDRVTTSYLNNLEKMYFENFLDELNLKARIKVIEFEISYDENGKAQASSCERFFNVWTEDLVKN